MQEEFNITACYTALDVLEGHKKTFICSNCGKDACVGKTSKGALQAWCECGMKYNESEEDYFESN